MAACDKVGEGEARMGTRHCCCYHMWRVDVRWRVMR